jgi:hypothetical protein
MVVAKGRKNALRTIHCSYLNSRHQSPACVNMHGTVAPRKRIPRMTHSHTGRYSCVLIRLRFCQRIPSSATQSSEFISPRCKHPSNIKRASKVLKGFRSSGMRLIQTHKHPEPHTPFFQCLRFFLRQIHVGAHVFYKLPPDQNSEPEIPCRRFNVFPVRIFKGNDAEAV